MAHPSGNPTPNAPRPLRPGALLLNKQASAQQNSKPTVPAFVSVPGALKALRPGSLAHLSSGVRTVSAATSAQLPNPTPGSSLPQQRSLSVAPALATPKRRTPQPTTAEVCAQTLARLELEDPALALLCAPSGFMDCTDAKTSITGLAEDDYVMLHLRKTGRVWGYDVSNKEIQPHPFSSLYEAPWPTHWKRVHRLRVELADENDRRVYITLFGGTSVRTQDPQGMMLLHGVIKSYGSKMFIQRPEQIPKEAFGTIYPRYATPGNTTNEAGVRGIVAQALNIEDATHKCTTELVRKTLLSESHMMHIAGLTAAQHHRKNGVSGCGIAPRSVAEMLDWMHTPPSMAHGRVAVACARAIAVEGIRHVARHNNQRQANPKCPVALTPQIIQRVVASQPERLTDDQSSVIDAVCMALQRPFPLTGLLSGDVGTGKTLTFAVPAVATHLAGGKVCVLAPTEILANQTFDGLSRRFHFARVERVATGKKIQDPGAILVGTAGLCSVARKANYQPNLLIVDEQHKLSTEIRSSLCAPWTHLIEASATPIPRSLAASLFAGMEIFSLTNVPVKREIQSHLLDEEQRGLIIKRLRAVISSGDRAAFIYPRINSSTTAQASVLKAAESLGEHFPGQICVLHGKMRPEEIQAALDGFRLGTTPIVVSSTVMETGIDVPDIRLMVVRDAENFGVAQLHQLRGRLARNGGPADFFMLVKNFAAVSEDTIARLEMVKTTADGYALAEADMRQRGFGNLAGDTQSGSTLSPIRLLSLTIDDFDSSSFEH